LLLRSTFLYKMISLIEVYGSKSCLESGVWTSAPCFGGKNYHRNPSGTFIHCGLLVAFNAVKFPQFLSAISLPKYSALCSR
jgi:hypothetical protein